MKVKTWSIPLRKCLMLVLTILLNFTCASSTRVLWEEVQENLPTTHNPVGSWIKCEQIKRIGGIRVPRVFGINKMRAGQTKKTFVRKQTDNLSR